VSASVKVMRDLYDRSARRPLCVPKLWLVDNLMVKEIQGCKTHRDYVDLLSTPVFRICPFMVSFKRRLKLFERIVTTSRIEMQGVNDGNPFNTNPLKPGIPVQIMRGRVLEDGLATLNKLGRNLRQRINVQYLNEAGTRESGVDAGGLFKEFWTDLCAIAFNPNYALFRVTEGESFKIVGVCATVDFFTHALLSCTRRRAKLPLPQSVVRGCTWIRNARCAI
jgi:ubiquitin-protein ligase E3 C